MAINLANNSSLANITALPASITGGGLTLVSSQTASASASLEFSMDSTYDSYVFKFIDINPATNDVDFTFNLSTDSGSNYNVTKTTTYVWTYHNESDAAAEIVYETGSDLAQSTGFQKLARRIGSGADESNVGNLQIFNPSSSTYVKHFIGDVTGYYAQPGAISSHRNLMAGYGNTTSPVTNIKFQMSSGNFDGIIKMYGVA